MSKDGSSKYRLLFAQVNNKINNSSKNASFLSAEQTDILVQNQLKSTPKTAGKTLPTTSVKKKQKKFKENQNPEQRVAKSLAKVFLKTSIASNNCSGSQSKRSSNAHAFKSNNFKKFNIESPKLIEEPRISNSVPKVQADRYQNAVDSQSAKLTEKYNQRKRSQYSVQAQLHHSSQIPPSSL